MVFPSISEKAPQESVAYQRPFGHLQGGRPCPPRAHAPRPRAAGSRASPGGVRLALSEAGHDRPRPSRGGTGSPSIRARGPAVDQSRARAQTGSCSGEPRARRKHAETPQCRTRSPRMDPSLDGPTLRHVIELSRQPFRVVIAGGGIAGIEATLALREFAGDAVDISVIDPGARFRVPATATGRAFGLGQGVDLPLADVVYRAGGSLVAGRIESVEPGARHGDARGRQAPALRRADRRRRCDSRSRWFRERSPSPATPTSVRFAAWWTRSSARPARRRSRPGWPSCPPGCGWPLAAYELALMAREHLAQLGGRPRPASASSPPRRRPSMSSARTPATPSSACLTGLRSPCSQGRSSAGGVQGTSSWRTAASCGPIA